MMKMVMQILKMEELFRHREHWRPWLVYNEWVKKWEIQKIECDELDKLVHNLGRIMLNILLLDPGFIMTKPENGNPTFELDSVLVMVLILVML